MQHYSLKKEDQYNIGGYKMKFIERFTSTFLGIVFSFSLLLPSYASYSDMHAYEQHWAKQTILWAIENHLVTGTFNMYGTLSLSMNDTLDRAQAITILYRYAGEPAVNTTDVLPFTDIPEDAYYYNAVAWAMEHHMIQGMSETTFAPHTAISRQDAAVLLHRYESLSNTEAAQSLPDDILSSYIDVDKISVYAQSAVTWALHSHIMQGNDFDVFFSNTIQPKLQIARAEYLRMLHSYHIMKDTDPVFSIDSSELSSIEIRNGNNGDLAVLTDEATIREVTAQFNQFKAESKQFIPAASGYSYSFRFFDKQGEECLHFLLSKTSILRNEVKYTSKDADSFSSDWFRKFC